MEAKMKVLNRIMYLNESRDIAETLKHLYQNLDLLVYLHEILGQENVILKENEIFLESLVLKFYLHGISLYNIASGYKITSNYLDNKILSKNEIIDISSLFTVGRAQLETLLMYYHIYVNEKDENVQNLRYYAWLYSALLQRLEYQDARVPEEVVENTRMEIEMWKNKIINCPAYNNLSEKQQKALIAKGDGKTFKKWNEIFTDCNFSKKGFVQEFYYILSVYAHSEGLSGIQLKQMKYFKSGKTNQTYMYLQIATSWILTSAMIKNLVDRFPVIKIAYNKLDNEIKLENDMLIKILYNN